MCSDRSQCTQGTRDKWVQSGNDQGWRIMFLPADRSWLALFYQLLSFKLWNYPASSVVSVWLTTAVAIKTNAPPCLFCSLSPSVQASHKGGLRGRIGERFKSSENTRYNHLCINHPERGKTNIPRAHLRSYKERLRHLCKVIGANIPRPLWRSLRVHW